MEQVGPSSGGESVSGLGRGVLWKFADTTVRIAGEIFLVAYAVRGIGVEEFGLFAIAATVTALFATVDFGLGAAVIRAAAREQALEDSEPEQGSVRREVTTAHATYVAVAGLLLLVTLLLLIVLPAVLNVKGNEADLRTTTALVGSGLAVSVASAAMIGVATGQRRFGVVAFSSMVSQVINVVIVILLLRRFGVVALGIGRLLSACVQSGILVSWLKRAVSWFLLWPRRPRLADLRSMTAFALPLLVIAGGAQIVATTDLIAIGALATAAHVGVYRASSAIPSRALMLLFSGYDVIFPFLAREGQQFEQEKLLRSACMLFSYLAGCGFGFMIWSRTEIIALLLGYESNLGDDVLLLFSLAWLTNIPAHGITLVLIARARHGSFIPLVAAELTVNVLLTVALVKTLGPVGAALATFLTISLADVLFLPWVVRREFVVSIPRTILQYGVAPAALGIAVALGAASLIGGPGALRLAGTALLTGIFGLGAGRVMLNSEGLTFLRAALARRS